ncbi:MAG: hypothetical protein UT61_C0010G0008 [Candidatus Woesebacteria bacterium GW2011_GWA1_39_8]|uniref:Uncharacterized protein n=1 Tax=Candidatus Woesebacteria bacterium GW2011_GWA1_39_8 TaxID=1618552 RepID=A0A0G0S687_9BACT|nr:MAG: hypothetical protein UT61_C0010G0008 [Candidatus Woesebacteria bacterium GW2011_GWA1_39_8]
MCGDEIAEPTIIDRKVAELAHSLGFAPDILQFHLHAVANHHSGKKDRPCFLASSYEER